MREGSDAIEAVETEIAHFKYVIGDDTRANSADRGPVGRSIAYDPFPGSSVAEGIQIERLLPPRHWCGIIESGIDRYARHPAGADLRRVIAAVLRLPILAMAGRDSDCPCV